MADNIHRTVPSAQRHNPKDFETAGNSTACTKNAAGALEWQAFAGGLSGNVWEFEGNGTAATEHTTGVAIFCGQQAHDGANPTIFNVTEEGTAAGTAIFSEIWSVTVTAFRDTTAIADIPIATGKVVAVDLKTIEVNVVESNDVVILGNEGLEPDTDVEVIIHIKVIGLKA